MMKVLMTTLAVLIFAGCTSTNSPPSREVATSVSAEPLNKEVTCFLHGKKEIPLTRGSRDDDSEDRYRLGTVVGDKSIGVHVDHYPEHDYLAVDVYQKKGRSAYVGVMSARVELMRNAEIGLPDINGENRTLICRGRWSDRQYTP